MDGLVLLDEARQAGLTVLAQGEKLVVRGPKSSAAVAQQLTSNKAAVLAALKSDFDEPTLSTLTKPRDSRAPRGFVNVDNVDSPKAELPVARLALHGLDLVRRFDGLVVLCPIDEHVGPLPADFESELDRHWPAVAAQAEPEAAESLEEIDCPPPCPKCNGLELWQSMAGVWRCMACDLPKTALRLLDLAVELRERPRKTRRRMR